MTIKHLMWERIPEYKRLKIINSVWCRQCEDTIGITNFVVESHDYGVKLSGECIECGCKICRMVEK